ncbi:MAG: outer membrane beta-barrel protein [Nitrospira sp.]|nr:outer membrane beta-barrel protein [Nitrospira sp.]
MNRFVACVVLVTVFLLQVEQARSEWYVGAYGGYSAAQPLKDVTMNNFGENLALERYGFTTANRILGDTLVQNFQSSNLSLNQSALFGGKAGYFFNDQGFSWLGVELEAFTTTPTIKTQTVSTEQGITFIKHDFNPACPLPAPTNQCSVQEHLKSTLSLTESSLRLITVVFNVVARYPGTTFQPYVGVGGGAFYFSSSGQIDGRQVVPGLNLQAGLKVLATEEWGLFVEGKYNYATITNLDPTGFGLSGVYDAVNILAGVAYHF